jgi:VWFA-related protein
MTTTRYVSNCFNSPYWAVLAAIACLGWAAAQSIPPDEMQAHTVLYVPPPPVTLRTEVDLVEVPVVVRDGQHRAVAGLTKDDFEIYDAGKKQTITAFSVQRFTSPMDAGGGAKAALHPAAAADAAGPKGETRSRFVALCFDDLNIDAAALKPAKAAAERFVKTGLAPGDRVAVVTTAQPRDAEFTGDVPGLVERIANVTSNRRFSEDASPQCPRIRPYEAYLIVNHLDNQVLEAKVAEYQACGGRIPRPQETVTSMAQGVWQYALMNSRNTLRVIDGLVAGMAKLPGERMILLTSAGFLTGDLEADEDLLMAKALHAEVVIDTLDARGLYTVSPGDDASDSPPPGRVPRRAQIVEAQSPGRQEEAKDDGMAALAAGTGGTFYHNSNDLVRGFRELGMAPETMYVLGFAPSGGAANGRFHSLKVRLAAGKRYSLQARLGYTASSPNAAARLSPPSRLDSEVTASDTIADLPAEFKWEQRPGPPGITMVAHLDIARLHFETRQSRRHQKLTLVGVLLDARGGVVTGKRSELDLNFTEATFAQLEKTGVLVSLTIPAPPGSYSVRALVEDALEGKLTAAGGAVEIK